MPVAYRMSAKLTGGESEADSGGVQSKEELMMAKEMSKTEKMRELHGDKELSVEQLENVAGGTTYQLSEDSCFLNVLLRGHPDQCDRYGTYKLGDAAYGHEDRRHEIEKAWKAVGVEAWLYNGDSAMNTYFINNEVVTRADAFAHAMKVMGKQLQRSDWDWS